MTKLSSLRKQTNQDGSKEAFIPMISVTLIMFVVVSSRDIIIFKKRTVTIM